jgi:3-oxoacyl-[acyl-carrier protein] reductase
MAFTIDLEGKRALVTGSGQGVGRAIAHSLAKANARVVVNDVVADRAQAVVDEISAQGGAAEAALFSVTEWNDVVSKVEALGGVDILVNNAGNAGIEGFNLGPFVQTQPEDWDRYFAVNLFGVMHCTRAVLPGMIDREYGRVVTIVSDAGRFGDIYQAAYAAAKAGAAGFTRSIAREMGRYGVTVNNVSLASIRSPAMARVGEESPDELERTKRAMRGYIIRRRGEPEDVAGLVTYLVSPMASWITGQTYPVDGGYQLAL